MKKENLESLRGEERKKRKKGTKEKKEEEARKKGTREEERTRRESGKIATWKNGCALMASAWRGPSPRRRSRGASSPRIFAIPRKRAISQHPVIPFSSVSVLQLSIFLYPCISLWRRHTRDCNGSDTGSGPGSPRGSNFSLAEAAASLKVRMVTLTLLSGRWPNGVTLRRHKAKAMSKTKESEREKEN
jgi:hypothetical protein